MQKNIIGHALSVGGETFLSPLQMFVDQKSYNNALWAKVKNYIIGELKKINFQKTLQIPTHGDLPIYQVHVQL